MMAFGAEYGGCIGILSRLTKSTKRPSRTTETTQTFKSPLVSCWAHARLAQCAGGPLLAILPKAAKSPDQN